jgi:hypothetical protein
MRLPLVLLAIFLGSVCAGFSADKKAPPVMIRLHGEGKEQEGASFVSSVELTNPPKKIFIRKVPVLNEKDFKSFYPFPGRDGMIGAYFVLDAHGADKLLQFTIEDRGQLAVIMINGRVASALKVAAPVKDGILYVPGGILPNEVVQLQQKYPIVGRESEFGKKPKVEKAKPANQ